MSDPTKKIVKSICAMLFILLAQIFMYSVVFAGFLVSVMAALNDHFFIGAVGGGIFLAVLSFIITTGAASKVLVRLSEGQESESNGDVPEDE